MGQLLMVLIIIKKNDNLVQYVMYNVCENWTFYTSHFQKNLRIVIIIRERFMTI